MLPRATSRGAGSEARGEGKERGYISRITSQPFVFLLSLGFLWGWGFCGVADLYRKSSQQRKLRITSLRMFGGVQISFTWVGLCSDAVLYTFCSSSHGSNKLAPVTASSIFLKCFVLPHQTRPNVRAEYLVWENKQFECPGDLRECSFGRQISVSVALSN